MSLEGYISQCRQRVDKALHKALPDNSPVSKTLVEAMSYSVFNGGKRVRPLLTYAACETVGGCIDNADPAACAIELIHAYSLVHDDLPAMDDDDLRRGKPTCHKAYDEATAILAGDALQTMAFAILSHSVLFPHAELSDKQRLQQIQTLSVASGYAGMVGGQAMDLSSTGIHLTQDQLVKMHSHKTGALIRACVRMGALSQPEVHLWQLEQLDQYATTIGLAFQVQDDILDVIADTQTLGKQQGADKALDKPTYVSILGLPEAQAFATELCQSAIKAIVDFGPTAEPLQLLAEYIVKRSY